MTPSNGSPTQKHCPTLAPAFLHTNVGLPYLEPFILLTRFLALLLSKLCAFFLLRRQEWENLWKKGKKNNKNLHHHSAKHIWHTSAPHCPFSGHTTLMETCPLWQRHSVTDWHLSGEKLVHLLLTCWTALGCWGCLVFCFTLLSTSWDSWNWWKPDTVKDCHLFWWETGAVTSDLLDCLWILGVLGCSASHYSLLLGTPGTGGSQTHCQILPLFLVGTWCICYWLAGLPGILGMLRFLLHTTIFFLGLLVLMELLKV